MGFQSRLSMILCCVSFVLLFSISCVQSQCPLRCECDAKGFKAKCSNQNLLLLPQGIFNRKVSSMDLSFNRIGILRSSMFADRQIYSLVNLTMSNNTISVLDEPFRGLSALEYLDLSNNDIETFKPEIFDDVQHLQTLVLHHNPYLELSETGYDLPELINLILNNCRIKTIPSKFFNMLKSLEYLNLSENLIENFNSKLLISDLNNLKHVDLRSNRLFRLGDVVDQMPTSVKVLELSSNAWACNCEIKEAFELYVNGNYENSSLVCSTPEDLKNYSLTAELVKLITCTTTTEETTSQSTTVVIVTDVMVNDRARDVKTVSNSSVPKKNEKIIIQSAGTIDKGSEIILTDKIIEVDDDATVVRAGWYGNWMIYSAIALVIATSIVVFFVKYQVSKHMRRPGNVLERNSADFGMSADGYQSVSLSEGSSRAVV